MGRVYTIDFTFQKKSYTAVVTKLGESLSVYVPDESLHNLIPNGKASIKNAKNFIIDPDDHSTLYSLLTSILSAIDVQKGTTSFYQEKSQKKS
jgi:hypothetical protein